MQRAGIPRFSRSLAPFRTFLRASCILLPILACQELKAEDEDDGAGMPERVKVAIIQDQRPDTFIDAITGRASGFAVDIIEAVARRAGFEIEYLPMGNWKEIEDALVSGKADLCPSMAVNESRHTLANFTEPTEIFNIVACVKASRGDLKSFKDLAKGRIGVVRSSMSWTVLKSVQGMDLVLYDSYQSSMMEMLSGRIDAFVTASCVIEGIARESGIEDKVRLIDIPNGRYIRAIGVRKADIELFRRVNKAFLQLASSTEYESIYHRWHAKPEPFWTPERVAAVMGSLLVALLILAMIWRHSYLIAMNAALRKNQEELKAAKELAESGAKARDLFLATITHELRTPLNAILGFAEFLEEDLKAYDGPRKERIMISIKTIKDSGSMLLSLIEDILELSRMEQHKFELINMDFNPRHAIDEVTRSFLPGLLRKGVRLEIETKDLPELILTDGKRFKQILYNLIGNAMKFTNAGSISVLARAEGGFLVIQVSDTGEGIPEDKLSEIFIPFYQVSHESSRLHGGLGLGLAIVKRIVDLMHGEISVSSVLGEGSKFTVKIPLTVQVDAEEPAPQEEIHAKAS